MADREPLAQRIRNLGPGMLISIAFHLIVGAGLVVFTYKEIASKDEAIPVSSGFQAFKPPTPQQQEQEKIEIERKGIPKNLEAELSPRKEDEVSDEEIPDLTIDNAVEADHNERDTGADDNSTGGDDVFSSYAGHTGNKGLSSAIGVGGGGGRGGGRGHGLGGRHNLVSRGRRGSTQGTEAAVLYGLTWLARHQMPDGSWDATAYQDRCADASCTGPGHPRFSDGLTGLALLAFLGAGYSHDSKQFVKDPKTGEKLYFGEAVKKGLKYLVDKQQPDGSFGSDKYMYNQSICAMAVGEAYALTGARWPSASRRRRRWTSSRARRTPARRARLPGLALPAMEGVSDASITGWCVVALKSGELAALKINPQSMEGRAQVVKQATNSEFKTGYLSAGDAGQKIENPGLGEFDHHRSMTAVSVMIRTFVTFRMA
ncbi:MAG: prenyltransferase/squalene oxidase repeat-containing protein [Planctomycetota bacterium]